MVCATLSIAQEKDVPFKKKYFKENKEAFDVANEDYLEGEFQFSKGPRGYSDAIHFFEKANEFNPNSAELNFMLGICYLSDEHKFEAFKYFDKALVLNVDVSDYIYYYLGRAHHLHQDWDEAKNYYKKYEEEIKSGGSNYGDVIKRVDRRIRECEVGKELAANPVKVELVNIGTALNTEHPEHRVVINADESIMMFTSQIPTRIDENIVLPLEDVFVSRRSGTEESWGQRVILPEPVNLKYNDAPSALSPEGHSMFLYSDRDGKGGDFYETRLVEGKWSDPKLMNEFISSKHHESSASFSYNGKSLYFVSDRPKGLGGHDIYVSNWDEATGDWGRPVNLGADVNTEFNEESVFMHPDGKTMYFSSQGHKTMGGFDIFSTQWNDSLAKWDEPVNIGYPVNGPDNDVGLVVSASGKHGYIAVFHAEGEGEEDIYQINFLQPKEEHLTLLKGTIMDAVTKKPIHASIEILDLELHEEVSRFESDAQTGHYLVSLPAGKNYGIEVESPDHLFHSQNINLPESDTYHEIVKDIYLEQIEVGKTIVLNNVFFDYDQATLRPQSKDELQVLIKFMTDNPTIKVELSGHTDSRGSDTYNQKLSEDRAHAVVDYLVAHGLDKKRLVYVGYGETKPVATNDSEEGRQLNRRTELKILSK
jgi:outer membrane protein OmpA-like peptidoglycan-associated protein/tetratricopeptide (TPR) repeat protein